MTYLTPTQQSFLQTLYTAPVPRAELRGRTAIEKMADDMLVIAARADCITEDDMELLGWTPAQIALHAADARRKAYQQAARSRR